MLAKASISYLLEPCSHELSPPLRNRKLAPQGSDPFFTLAGRAMAFSYLPSTLRFLMALMKRVRVAL